MPAILITLGNAYGIHILSRFYDEVKREGRGKAIENTLAAVGTAVLMAGTTTIAGFLSNCTSGIVQMREFGFSPPLASSSPWSFPSSSSPRSSST